MEKCPNCDSSELIKVQIDKKSSYDGQKIQTAFIINNIHYSIKSDDYYNSNKFLKIYEDFICSECRLVSRFVSQDIINKIKSSLKESESFENYYNSSTIKIIDFIQPHINSINDLFNPIDLMLDEALNENLSFMEVNNKRDNLKKNAKEFGNKNSEIFKKIEEIYKSFDSKYDFIKNLIIEFNKTFDNANFQGKYKEKNSNLKHIFDNLPNDSFILLISKRLKWAENIANGSLDKFNEP